MGWLFLSFCLLSREAWGEPLGSGLACHCCWFVTVQESAIVEQHPLPLLAHFPRPLTGIWQKASLTQRNRPGQEMRWGQSRETEKIQWSGSWEDKHMKAYSWPTSVGHTSRKPWKKCPFLTAVVTAKVLVPGRKEWFLNKHLIPPHNNQKVVEGHLLFLLKAGT